MHTYHEIGMDAYANLTHVDTREFHFQIYLLYIDLTSEIVEIPFTINMQWV